MKLRSAPEPGRFVRSIAGHDTGKIYVVISAECGIVLLADGITKTMDTPKRKKWKHVDALNAFSPELKEKLTTSQEVSDSDLRRALKTFEIDQERI